MSGIAIETEDAIFASVTLFINLAWFATSDVSILFTLVEVRREMELKYWMYKSGLDLDGRWKLEICSQFGVVLHGKFSTWFGG